MLIFIFTHIQKEKQNLQSEVWFMEMTIKFKKKITEIQEKERRTVVDTRKGARMTKNGPKVEAVNGPKPRKQNKSELVEPSGIAQ